MKQLVIIPTYNEALTVERITEEIFKLYEGISILIVDDSSPDGTADVVRKLQASHPDLYLLVQEKKFGLSRAYINGMKWGLEKGFDVFSTCDADFSHNPKYLASAIEAINDGYDCACGSRYMSGGHTQETNWFKNFISKGGNVYARLILGREIKDWTEGFNTYTKDALSKIDLDSIKAVGYIWGAEMKYKAVHKGLKVKEFPIDFAEREEGQSKMSFYIIFEAFFFVLKIRLGL